MTMPLTRVAVLVSTCAASLSCAEGMKLAANPLKKATIEVYVDAANQCRTKTTPYFKVSQGARDKATWNIVDGTGCTDPIGVEVEVRFDKLGVGDPLPFCRDKKDKGKIECDLGSANTGRFAYSVYLGASKEDPEIEIVQ